MKERTIITIVALIVIGVCAWGQSYDNGVITLEYDWPIDGEYEIILPGEIDPGFYRDLRQGYRTLLLETPYEVISYPPLAEPKTVTAPCECEQLKQENEYLKRENCLLRELVDVYHKLVNLLEGKS